MCGSDYTLKIIRVGKYDTFFFFFYKVFLLEYTDLLGDILNKTKLI